MYDTSQLELMNLYDNDCAIARASKLDPAKTMFANMEKISAGYNIYKSEPYGRFDGGYSGNIWAFDWGNV